ncbi:MAG: hypothetical protein QW400_03240 [Candidatus Diapherotrites archaeon]
MPKKTVKKAGKEKLFLIIFVVSSVLFLALFAALLLTSATSGKTRVKEDLNYYKQYGSQIHAEIQRVIIESKEAALQEADTNFEDPEEVLTFNLYLSFMDDILWIGEAEKKNYEKLALSQSVEEAKELYRSEIAYSIVMHYVLIVNLVAEEQIPEMPDENIRDKRYRLAESLIKNPEKFEISKELFETFRSEFGLKTEEVQGKVNEVFSSYVKDLAARFKRSLAAENHEKAYIEAVKIINIANP